VQGVAHWAFSQGATGGLVLSKASCRSSLRSGRQRVQVLRCAQDDKLVVRRSSHWSRTVRAKVAIELAPYRVERGSHRLRVVVFDQERRPCTR